MNEEERSVLEERKMELLLIKSSLDEIKENKEIFVSLGAGIFLKAKILNTNKLLVNVGNNVFVEKTPEEIKKLIDEQIEEIDKLLK